MSTPTPVSPIRPAASARPRGHERADAHSLLLTNARVVTPHGVLDEGWVRTSGGTIIGVGEGKTPKGASSTINLDGRWLGPGFIDSHVHGGGGFDVMDGNPESIARIAQFLSTRGVTSFVATTYTASHEHMVKALRAIETARVAGCPGANLLGAQLEGPFLSRVRKGGHREELLHPASLEEVREYIHAAKLRVVVMAPEIAENAALISFLVERGIVVSVGHTDATYDEVVGAVQSGARLMTHLFNGMRPLGHREPGAAGAGLLLPVLTCELIADGVHIAPEIIRLVYLAKGLDAIMLVSDCGLAAGLPDGRHIIDGREIAAQGGAMYLPDGTLISSTRSVSDGFRNFRTATGLQIGEAWTVASTNAAELLGERSKGQIRSGADADFTILNDDGTVGGTIVGGQHVYEAW